MKFGEQIIKTLIPEWAQYYINYESLKDTLTTALQKHRFKDLADDIGGLKFVLKRSTYPSFVIKRVHALNPETGNELVFFVNVETGELTTPTTEANRGSVSMEISFLQTEPTHIPEPMSPTFGAVLTEDTVAENVSFAESKSASPERDEDRPSLARKVTFRGHNPPGAERAPEPAAKAGVIPEDVSPHFENILEKVQAINNIVARALAKEIDKVTKFYRHQSQLICGAACICIDTAKNHDQLTASERSALKTAFRQVYYSLDRLQQFCDLNVIAVAKFLKKFDKNTLQSSLMIFKDILEELPFSAVFHSKPTIQTLKGHMFDVYAQYVMKGSRKLASEALYLKDRADKLQESQPTVLSSGMIAGCCLTLFTLIIVEFAHFDFPLSYEPLHNTPYWLATSFTLLLLPVLFGFNVMAWESNSVNFAFVFDLDPTRPWSGLELLRNNSVYLLCWLICCYATLRTAIHDTRCDGSPSAIEAWLWPFFVIPMCLILHIFYAIVAKRQLWFLGTLKRLLMTPLLPVEFSDFFIADQLTSMGSVLFNLQFFWCYFDADTVTDSCEEGISSGAFGAAILPLVWRLLQCLRRYRDMPRRKPFPHLFNAVKYTSGICSVLSSFFLSMARYHKASPATEDAALAIYFICHIIMTLFTCTWDAIMDSGIVQVSWITDSIEDVPTTPTSVTIVSSPTVGTFASNTPAGAYATGENQSDHESEHTNDSMADLSSTRVLSRRKNLKKLHLSIRRNILYGSMVYYYGFLALNITMRFAWVAAFIVGEKVQDAPWKFVVFASIGIIRRFLWNFFRIENEQLNNYENYRATRFAPLPTRTMEMEVETAEDIYNRFKAKAVPEEAVQHGADASDWSALSRFFANLPEDEKRTILEKVNKKQFVGKQFEGKSKYFASLPEPVKAHLILTHIGKLTLGEYMKRCSEAKISWQEEVFGTTLPSPAVSEGAA